MHEAPVSQLHRIVDKYVGLRVRRESAGRCECVERLFVSALSTKRRAQTTPRRYAPFIDPKSSPKVSFRAGELSQIEFARRHTDQTICIVRMRVECALELNGRIPKFAFCLQHRC